MTGGNFLKKIWKEGIYSLEFVLASTSGASWPVVAGRDFKKTFRRKAVYSSEFVLAFTSGSLLARCDRRGLKRFIPEGSCLFRFLLASTSGASWPVATGGDLKDSSRREALYSLEFVLATTSGAFWPVVPGEDLKDSFRREAVYCVEFLLPSTSGAS